MQEAVSQTASEEPLTQRDMSYLLGHGHEMTRLNYCVSKTVQEINSYSRQGHRIQIEQRTYRALNPTPLFTREPSESLIPRSLPIQGTMQVVQAQKYFHGYQVSTLLQTFKKEPEFSPCLSLFSQNKEKQGAKKVPRHEVTSPAISLVVEENQTPSNLILAPPTHRKSTPKSATKGFSPPLIPWLYI